MQNFTYYNPTEIVFGRGTEAQAPALVQKYGGTRVFLLYGGGSALRSGLIQRLEKLLLEAGLKVETKGGVQPNPLLSFAEEARGAAAEFGADFVLAVGGGSVIDSAKAVAHGLANPTVKLWDFWEGKAALERTTPVGVVLTIPAAGSESSDSSVLTNAETGRKKGLGSLLNRPKFAVMNPELTATLPKFQVACGVVDIMMHTLDRYFTEPAQNAMTDAAAEALLRTAAAYGRRAVRDPGDYEAMSELMWAGNLSHNGLTGLGAVKDFSVHQLGHELSGKYDVAHGASLSAVWGSWADYCMEEHPERFAQLGRAFWGIQEENPRRAAKETVSRMVRYFSSLGMPTCFTELGIGVLDERTLSYLAESCSFFGGRTVGAFKVLDEADLRNIYAMANH